MKAKISSVRPASWPSTSRIWSRGLDVQVFALYIAPGLPPGKTIKRAMSMAGTFFQALEASNGKFVMARTVREVRAAVASGRKCGLLAVEGGHIIEGDLNILRSLRNMGVVTMTLTHANTNEWADSSQDERRWGGLNDLGREVIREMNRLRMLIDVSHTSDETVEAVLEISDAPVIASHSCCRAICDHPRNLTDGLIKKIASKGGLIDMAYYPLSWTTRLPAHTRSDGISCAVLTRLRSLRKKIPTT
ncbi:membrane dipeptidase [Tunturiibacter gelidiferens]